jgi:hypothetical protein
VECTRLKVTIGIDGRGSGSIEACERVSWDITGLGTVIVDSGGSRGPSGKVSSDGFFRESFLTASDWASLDLPFFDFDCSFQFSIVQGTFSEL